MSTDVIEEVFEEIYDLIRDSAFEKIDAILDAVDVEAQPTVTLIGFLSASNPAKRYLAGRVRLLARVEAKLREAGALEGYDELLRGLR